MADTSLVDPSGNRAAGLRPVACERCRNRRSFCTKELPKCARCRDNKLECVYPPGRKITVSEAYLRSLEERVRELEDAATAPSNTAVHDWVSLNSIEETVETESSAAEPDLEVSGVLQDFTELTVDDRGNWRTRHIGVAAPTAFTRRLSSIAGVRLQEHSTIDCKSTFYKREALRVNKQPSGYPLNLPPMQIAMRWYSAHYSYIGTIFAFSTHDWFEQELLNAYCGPPDLADSEACLAYTKVLTILAFGQLYSVNEWTSIDGPPGYDLFCHAVQYLPSIHEESSLLFVETLALVGYYMQNLGERDAAFLYVGTALRMAIALALHQEVRSSQLDEIQKERRRRVWWSVYSMDRILTIKSGNPIMVQDEDINVNPPSRLRNELIDEPEYGPWIVLRKYTELSRILSKIMQEVYRTHGKTGSGLMASVQSILASLSEWNRSLPAELLFNEDKLDFTRESVSTFLHYYQCINMTVRPLLFLIVERRMKSTTEERAKDWRHDLSPPTIKAIKTCIEAAQDTIRMITIASQKNLFATYGYMDGEHCFSAALVLVLVCVAFPCNEQDYKIMDSALRMLHAIVGRGNSNMIPRFQLLLQVRSRIVTPLGTQLPELFPPGTSMDLSLHAHLDPMLPSFPQVNNATLGELWQDSSPSNDFGLWEASYTSTNSNIEYDFAQLAQPSDNFLGPESL